MSDETTTVLFLAVREMLAAEPSEESLIVDRETIKQMLTHADEAIRLSDRVATAQAALERVNADFDEVSAQRDALTEQVAKLKAAASKTANAAKVTRKPAPAKAGKFGPGSVDLDGDGRRALETAMEAGHPFQIVACDAKGEIRAVDRAEVSGLIWQRSGDKMKLTVALTFSPSAPATLKGFALLDGESDGKVLGWCELPDAVPLAAGSETAFGDAILF